MKLTTCSVNYDFPVTFDVSSDIVNEKPNNNVTFETEKQRCDVLTQSTANVVPQQQDESYKGKATLEYTQLGVKNETCDTGNEYVECHTYKLGAENTTAQTSAPTVTHTVEDGKSRVLTDDTGKMMETTWTVKRAKAGGNQERVTRSRTVRNKPVKRKTRTEKKIVKTQRKTLGRRGKAKNVDEDTCGEDEPDGFTDDLSEESIPDWTLHKRGDWHPDK